jgi:hypothetical protein
MQFYPCIATYLGSTLGYKIAHLIGVSPKKGNILGKLYSARSQSWTKPRVIKREHLGSINLLPIRTYRSAIKSNPELANLPHWVGDDRR